ncbi:ectoine/hydroxyectoine ABC transporter permease subunit EhuC, partial [Burkholderia multivorans]
VGLLIYFVIAWLIQEFMNLLERRAVKRLGRRRPGSRNDRRRARRDARVGSTEVTGPRTAAGQSTGNVGYGQPL